MRSVSIHLQRNTLDPIKQVFDISAMKIDSDSWVKNELIRQQDKTINNRIGDFHQRLLGKVDGWEDLGTGDTTKVDLRKEDNSIFMELQNKENTVNADSKDQVRRKLSNIRNSVLPGFGLFKLMLMCFAFFIP